MTNDSFDTLRDLASGSAGAGKLHSIIALEHAGLGRISRLPVSIRIVLESLLRNCDGTRITEEHVRQLAGWQPNAPRTAEIPFVVSRIVLQDFTGVPLLCDLAAMRSAAQRAGADPRVVEPLVPVDLVVDHSVQVDHYEAADALDLNMKLEFRRNAERYKFIKWGMQAFDTFRVVPPGIGIVHQVNLEYLARGVLQRDGIYYPDTLVGTDSHTTMINALGVVGWGVGGIEAEAGMLGQPVYFLTPDVVGVHLHGRLREGVTATDLVLTVTERLRAAKVVGKFVEFFGDGAASLAVPDRATIANMAPEYGATLGYFPVDERTVAYLEATGRSAAEVDAFRAYFKAQGLFGMPQPGDIDYSEVLVIDLAAIEPSVAGPKRPQDRIALAALRTRSEELLAGPAARGGYGKPPAALARRTPLRLPAGETDIGHGDVLIAAITSCTNTSNPGVMLAAGLLAKKAVERGLTVGARVKTSLAPGSRVVTEYLTQAGLLPWLERLGFRVVAYGCTTCIGNSGPLDPAIEVAIRENDLVCAAVLSGNRNFEARIHPAIKANFLMSPPLVVAFAIAGRVDIDLTREPLGTGSDGRPVYLKDVWPAQDEIARALHFATDPQTYRRLYRDSARGNALWNAIPESTGETYAWEPSTYIAEPPFFRDFGAQPRRAGEVTGARALAIFGDSVTTDHISPAGSIAPDSPAGRYLQACGVAVSDFNSYGSRRGNHEVMVRGTFANVRIRNVMLPPDANGMRPEGGLTVFQPGGAPMSIYDAAMRYLAQGTPTLVFAGAEYGTGSSRDWAAKGTALLGVVAVVAKSFERIHRSNLVGMGVLPLEFAGSESAAGLGIRGDETFDLLGIEGGVTPRQEETLVIHRPDGSRQEVALRLRVDTPVEVEYLLHGGILPYVLGQLLGPPAAA
ncbi:MAG: aconitate hydratase 1 [Betaproteobacteria bacterium CG2_30_68_42]|nr:MAG: aconitate hydratase 1 [Betaproteobacteria bacterium CG2_30_68_42]PJA57581.1 MAG: aconitate hydratase AcnA [Rhodocyclales bacterium CG_4_9_14_3_um_filter_68_10]